MLVAHKKILISFLALNFITGCSFKNSEERKTQVEPVSLHFFSTEAEGRELILDPNFTLGANALNACLNPDTGLCDYTSTYAVKNPYYSATSVSPWSIAQWGSLSSLSDQGTQLFDRFQYADNHKAFSFLKEGFHRITNSDGIFYSNGNDAFCVFTSWDTFLKWYGGRTDGIGPARSLPENMRNDGACP